MFIAYVIVEARKYHNKKSSEPLHFEIVPRIRRLPTLLLGDGLLAVAPVRVDIGRLLCAGPGIKCIISV